MTIATVVTRGYGSGGSIAFVTTRGYGQQAVAILEGGHYVELPAERKRRLARERRLAEQRLTRFREMSVEAVIDDLQASIDELTAAPITDAEQEAVEAVQEILEPFTFDTGVDLGALMIDAARLEALVSRLARLSVEIENTREEDAVLLLLLHQ